ncbi:MAG TPA: hypothetical protein VMS64_00420 [Candidatus Methylomirabilis sp.]|nr:hypothetical protein [Candidatus Methylomirabilis sp.]
MFVVYDLGWIEAPSVKRGVPVRMGLVWKGDPGVTFVTARTDRIGSSVTRTDHARELRGLAQAPFYETVEWMTLTADGPDDFLELLLGWARFM